MAPVLAPRLVCLVVAVLTACGAASPAGPRSGGSPLLSLEHRSSMGSAFTLVGLRASLDGIPLATIGDLEGTAEPPVELATPVCVLATRGSPGSHSLRLELTYAGNGFGVFSYLRTYRFHDVDTYTLDVPDGAREVVVRSVGHEGGGAATPIEDRPAVAWTLDVASDAVGCVVAP